MSTAATEVEKLVAAVAELMKQPATLVENLSFSNRAVVARVLLASDETVVAKSQPCRRCSQTRLKLSASCPRRRGQR